MRRCRRAPCFANSDDAPPAARRPDCEREYDHDHECDHDHDHDHDHDRECDREHDSTTATPNATAAGNEHSVERRWRIEELIERHAHAQSVAELPPELRGNPMIVSIVSMTPEEEEARDIALCEAHSEAYELYGDDPVRILAAFEAGSHPLQRRKLSSRDGNALARCVRKACP